MLGPDLVEVGKNLLEAFGAQAVGQAPRAAVCLHRAGRAFALGLEARAERRLAPLILSPAGLEPSLSVIRLFLLITCKWQAPMRGLVRQPASHHNREVHATFLTQCWCIIAE